MPGSKRPEISVGSPPSTPANTHENDTPRKAGPMTINRHPRAWFAIALVLAMGALALAAAAAAAAEFSEELRFVALRDQLQRTESPLSAGGNWAALAWAEDEPPIGAVTGTGWHPTGAAPLVAGAYWTPASFSGLDAVEATIAATPGSAGSYGALWLNMPSPATAKTGFQLSWTYVEPAAESKSLYTFTFASWSAGVKTTLKTVSRAFPDGTVIALRKGNLNLMALAAAPGKGYSEVGNVLTKTFTSGYAGIEASGSSGRISEFRAGNVLPVATIKGFHPGSPGNSTEPLIFGTAPSGTTVAVYEGSSCAGTAVATGTAAEFAEPGLEVEVAPNSTTAFTVRAENAETKSACSALPGASYVEDSVAPAPPKFTFSSPSSPSSHTGVRIAGTFEKPTGEEVLTLRLYASANCSGEPEVTENVGGGSNFGGVGTEVVVPENATTPFSATLTDAAGNVSECSPEPLTYVNDAEELLFEGAFLSDFETLQQCVEGRARQVENPLGNRKRVMVFEPRESDVASNEECEGAAAQPTAVSTSPAFIEPGAEFWLRARLLIPTDLEWLEPGELVRLIDISDPDAAGLSPWRLEAGPLGEGFPTTSFVHRRNATFGFDIPWAQPLVANEWVEVLLHEKFAAEGFVEEWFNGEQERFFAPPTIFDPNGEEETTRLEMATMDASNEGGLNAVTIGQVHPPGEFEATPIYFDYVKLGETRESVGG
jgi:hypothetical protein